MSNRELSTALSFSLCALPTGKQNSGVVFCGAVRSDAGTMQRHITHPWKISPREAAALQRALAASLVLRNAPRARRVLIVAGCDVSYSRRTNICYAAVAALSFPEFAVLEESTAVLPATFPYVPGLLTFREGPALAAALERLRCEPDVLVFDGQGLAHPRGFGLACHMGLLFGVPSIGCAKSHFFGDYDEPGAKAGAASPLRHPQTGRVIGAVLRSRAATKPLFISPGHRFGPAGALAFMRCCLGRWRLPEASRRAHTLSNNLRMEHEGGTAPARRANTGGLQIKQIRSSAAARRRR